MRSEVWRTAWRSALVAALLLAIGVPAYTQVGGAVGGVPQRLRVQSLGVGVAAPAGNGDATIADALTVTGVTALGDDATLARNVNGTAQIVIDNDSNGTANAVRVSLSSGDASGALFVSGSGRTSALVTNGPTGAQAVLRTLGNYPLVFGTQNIERARLRGDGILELMGDGEETDGLALDRDVRIVGRDSSESFVHLASIDSDANVTWFGSSAMPTVFLGSSLTHGIGGVDMTPSSGTFTLNYVDCCSSTPTQSVRWYKIGSVVTLTAAAAMATTAADTTLFETSADVPAAIRPTNSNAYGPLVGARNNSASATGMVEILTNGEVVINLCGVVTGTCDGGAWNSGGNRSVDAWTVSYVQ